METTTTIIKNDISLIQIFWIKFKKVLENSSFSEIFKAMIIFIMAVDTTFILCYPETAKHMAILIFTWGNYVLIKFIASYLLFSNYEIIYNFIKNYFKRKIIEEDTIEGVPTDKLIDFLLKYKSFKRIDVEEVLKMSRNRYQKLADKLEEEKIKILVRGENNSRVLNERFGKEELEQVLFGKSKASEIKQVFQNTGNGFFVSLPVYLDKMKSKIFSILEKEEIIENEEIKYTDDFKQKNLTIDLSDESIWTTTPLSPNSYEQKIKIENIELMA